MKDVYESPLSGRYASPEMLRLFSPDTRYSLWRKLWIALAEAEMELGLGVTQEQIDQMKAHVTDIDYDNVRRYEEITRHDVMAHIKAYGDLAPLARPIIHLGATSCYVTDNADLLILREGLTLLMGKLASVISRLADFAEKYKNLPTLGYTHLQPAQLTTVGKRACLWLQDLMSDAEELEFARNSIQLLGSRGATGTQMSFLALFGGDGGKADELESRIASKLGLSRVFPVSGQTYPRKLDSRVLCALSAVAQSAYKFAQDMRLLQSFKEMEEPFEKGQVGSSAMAYKRNPMRCERMCSLSRHIMALTQDAEMTASTQWFERTLDDSANRRISLPEAFLACDAVLEIYGNVADGLVVNTGVIARRVRENLPFMATEDILMEAVKRGADRQEAHERIRVHSQAAAQRMKEEGLESDLLERIAADPAFQMEKDQLNGLLSPEHYAGRSKEQVERYLKDYVRPFLEKHETAALGDIKI